MTGDEIVAYVRANYGDAADPFIPTGDIQQWVKQAVLDIYTMLPTGDMRQVVQEDSITLTSRRGDIPSTWDRIVSVYTTEGEATPVPSHVSDAIDTLGTYFQPVATTYSINGNEIVVNTADPAVTVQYTLEPTPITDFSAEITSIPSRYHSALADWATSLAYASEEDLEQATYYGQRAQAIIAGRVPQQGG